MDTPEKLMALHQVMDEIHSFIDLDLLKDFTIKNDSAITNVAQADAAKYTAGTLRKTLKIIAAAYAAVIQWFPDAADDPTKDVKYKSDEAHYICDELQKYDLFVRRMISAAKRNQFD